MIILLIFAFISGLITILAPCIWPLLPIILSATTSGGHRKPLGITVGILTSFTIFTLTISYIVKIIPFDPNILRLFAVVIIGFLGLTLAIPYLSQLLEGYVSRLSGRFATPGVTQTDGFKSGYITGFSLGIVWAPCAGPILATIATLAATRAVSFEVILVTIVYVLGVGIPLFIFATVGSRFFTKTKALSPYTGRIQQIFGVVMILTALAIYTNYDKVLQAKLLDAFPQYATFINDFEGNDAVKKQLDILKGKKESDMNKVKEMMPNIVVPSVNPQLPNLGRAPEFSGITRWLNLPEDQSSLSLAELKGKVVLVDFWTYTCVNCIRTLPHVTGWYEKYKNQGFVVVGIHSPEFEFEKNTDNVLSAIKRHNITYPVGQDNDFLTWKAYDNHYWPAKYLVDKDGGLRYFHFGEGKYEETEKAIQLLLKEKGEKVADDMLGQPDQTPQGMQTPETYLGRSRIDRFASPEIITGQKQLFTIPENLPEHSFAYEGEWIVQDEEAISGKNAALELEFYSSKVFLVITPKNDGGKVKVFLDGRLVDNKIAGEDVVDGVVTLDMPRLYRLIDLKGQKENHRLRLEFETEGASVYAFTFG